MDVNVLVVGAPANILTYKYTGIVGSFYWKRLLSGQKRFDSNTKVAAMKRQYQQTYRNDNND